MGQTGEITASEHSLKASEVLESIPVTDILCDMRYTLSWGVPKSEHGIAIAKAAVTAKNSLTTCQYRCSGAGV